MPRRKKRATVTGVLKGFQFDLPFVGFSTKFRSAPIAGKGKVQVHSINYGGSCREELIWDTREYLQGRVVTWKKRRNHWKRDATVVREMDLDHTSLKQPGMTHLWVNGEEDWEGNYKTVCRRTCCISKFPELLDAIVGPLAVALNPDRYQGDWWTTSPAEAVHGANELRWYGTDNFFLRHPVLTSLMMGMFRQGILLFEQGYDEAILRAVNRKDVEDCLTNADPQLAMRLLTTLRPWIEVPQKYLANNFSFPKGHWDRLRQLHRAIYRHGYDALFDADLQRSWNVAGSEEGQGRYDVSNGPMVYWGTTGNKVTVAGKRLVKLGK